jgi:Ca-activated chloride channel family protein
MAFLTRTRVRSGVALAALVAGAAAIHAAQGPQDQDQIPPGGFRFSAGVELINVNATVYDDQGQFVEGLTKDDFRVYEDDKPQTISQFSAERVPVSLGIAVDTSGSMSGEKIHAAESALNRFLYDLLEPEDQIFLYVFNDQPRLLEGWTTDRSRLRDALGRMKTGGGTALYDAVANAAPMAMRGEYQKKALIVISDGNDTSSRTAVANLREQIRKSEVLVYAIGIDAERAATVHVPVIRPSGPVPLPFPGRIPAAAPPAQPGGWPASSTDDRVNVAALRDITDDSGGRTEIIRDARDLNPATASIADELSRQYYLGYQATTSKDGRWHSIRVETRNPNYRVRARAGYVAN